MKNSVCTKCLQDKSPKELVRRGGESVCPGCVDLLNFLLDIQAEREQLRASKRRPPVAEKRPAPPRSSGRSPVGPTGENAPQTARPTTPDSRGRLWYAVAVYGGDRKAARTIKDYFARRRPEAVGRVLVPKAHQEAVRGGKVLTQYRRATPGYLLVRCHPDNLDDLGRCPCVAIVLPYTEEISADRYEQMEEDGDPPPHPVAVPDEQVEPFLRKGVRPDPTPFGPGDKVVIREGAFKGVTGVVGGGAGKDKVTVQILVLGAPVCIEDVPSNLQKIKTD